MRSPTKTTPKKTKLQLFLDEVNELCVKYQYEIGAKLTYTQQGIVPQVIIKNVPPNEGDSKGSDKNAGK